MRKLRKPITPVPQWQMSDEYEQPTPKEREAMIHRAMVLVWDSLHSHLDFYRTERKKNSSFEKRCVQEYATVLWLLSRLY